MNEDGQIGKRGGEREEGREEEEWRKTGTREKREKERRAINESE